MPAFRSLPDLRSAFASPDRPDGLRRVLEVGLVLVLAVQAARLAWLLLPPAALGAAPAGATPAVPVRPERLAIDAFHPVRGPAAVADASGLRLFAVRPADTGGSAILAPRDGPQRAWSVGDEVAPGVVLASVAPDHVVLDGGGRRSELRFAAPDAAAARTAPAPAAARAPAPVSAATATATTPGATDTSADGDAAIDPARLLADMGLRPEQVDGRVTGYTVIPRGDGAALRRAGLQAGDVLLSVNNEALDPERYATLADTLAGASTLTFTFRRDGQVRSATLQAKTP